MYIYKTEAYKSMELTRLKRRVEDMKEFMQEIANESVGNDPAGDFAQYIADVLQEALENEGVA